MATTAHADRIAPMPADDQYAAVELWRAAMATPGLIAVCDDEPGEPPVVFASKRWGNFVPQRLPSTQYVVRAATTVFMTSLPVGAEDKGVFDAIDSVSEQSDKSQSWRAQEPFEQRSFIQRARD